MKSLRYQLKSPRFPIHRDLLGIGGAETAPVANGRSGRQPTAVWLIPGRFRSVVSSKNVQPEAWLGRGE
jgi:hypothetical protein